MQGPLPVKLQSTARAGENQGRQGHIIDGRLVVEDHRSSCELTPMNHDNLAG